jgi:hypothetical protein
MRFAILEVCFVLVSNLFANANFADPPANKQQMPTVTITAPADAPTGEPVPVSISYTGDAVKWKFHSTDVDIIREFTEDPKQIKFRLFSKQPARVTLSAIATDNGAMGEIQITEVQLGPPKPLPPEDQFAKAVKQAFATESADDKAIIGKLAALYREQARQMATVAAATYADIFKDMQTAAGALGLKGKLKATQTTIAAELTRTLPPATKQIDDNDRKTGEQIFTRISLLLSELQ